MFKGRKLKKAENEFAEQTKSFDRFCAENNIEIKKEKKNTKRNVWIGVSATLAAAAVVVCCFIPLMRETPDNEQYYSEESVGFERITMDEIIDADYLLFDVEHIDDYSFAQSIHPNDKADVLLGYNIKNIVWYAESESVEYIYEFDCIIRTNSQYRFKDLVLYNDCSNEVKKGDVTYKYRLAENTVGENVYLTYEYNNVDYYIRMYETDYTSDITKDNVETFIQLAFVEGE